LNKFVHIKSVKTNIILFENIRTNYIESIVMSDFEYQKFNIKYKDSFSRKIVVSFSSILSSTYFLLFKYGKKHTIKTNILISYYYGVIKNISPKVVITYEGINTPIFGVLANSLPSINFLAMGLYQIREPTLRNLVPSLAFYYVWGDQDKNDLIKIGQAPGSISSIGSFISGLYFSMKPRLNTNYKYDICIVAALKHIPLKTHDLNESILVNFISNYLSLNPTLRVCVAKRPESSIKSVKQLVDQRTQDCYSDGLNGHNVTFIENTLDNFETYKAMDSSTVVIAQNSCAAFEALGWGHRVLFCQANKLWFKTPDDLYYSVTEHNQEKFNKLLDELFIISDNKYKENIKNNISKYCQSDINNPPHMIFQKKINELLLK